MKFQRLAHNHNWLLLLAFLLLVLLGSLQVFGQPGQRPSPTPPVPRISWSEQEIDVVLSPGESVTSTVTFTSSLDLEDVILEPVPEIEPFLTVTPAAFAAVSANTPQTVHISFNIPQDADFGTFDGTIHLRDGNRTYPQTVKLIVNVWKTFVSEELNFTIRYPDSFTIESRQGRQRVRLQNYVVASDDELEHLFSGEVFIEILLLTHHPNYVDSITSGESVQLGNTAGVRGFRSDNSDLSPFPGFDMYVPWMGWVYVIAGSYDGIDTKALNIIKRIQESFRTFPD
jgi:hypothetical protein